MAIGLAFGIVSVLWLGFIFNDTVIEITLTIAVSYVAYFTVCIFPNFSSKFWSYTAIFCLCIVGLYVLNFLNWRNRFRLIPVKFSIKVENRKRNLL